jgi:hypothetical protein
MENDSFSKGTAMPTKEVTTRKPLPKIPPGAMLNGAVCAQYKRCGRANCKCAGGRLHGPYYYRFTWEAGRVVKEYIPLSRVEEVEAACARHRAVQDERREGRRQFQTLLSRLRSTLRE